MMTRKAVSILLFIFMLAGYAVANGKKVAELPEVSRPYEVLADKERLYIIEGTTILVYSLTDYKLQVKFGKKGEGPKEFRVRPSGRVKISPLGDNIYISSIGKYSVFTKGGKFVKETSSTFGSNFMALTNELVLAEGIQVDGGKNYQVLNIYDSNLKKVTEIFRRVHFEQQGEIRIFEIPLSYKTYAGRAFVTGRRGFEIDIVDSKGKKINTIKRDYKKIKVTEKDKANVIEWFRQDPRYNDRMLEYIKQRIRFPRYYPAIDEIRVSDNKLYVRTHEVKDDVYEFVIFDIDGKYLKTRKMFLVKGDPVYPYHYAIANGKLYQVRENEDTESWDLYTIDFE